MKLIVAILAFLSISICGLAQRNDTVFVRYMDLHGDGENYRIDTLFSGRPTENHYLVGTTMLPNSSSSYMTYSYGLRLTGFSGSDCNSHSESEAYGSSKVLDVQRTDSTLIINCQVGENCCYDFLGDVAADDHGVLDLIYHGYGENCACNCCFGLTYTFSFENLYGEEKKEPTGIMINGEEATLFKL